MNKTRLSRVSKIFFVFIFIIIGLAASKISLFQIIGAQQKFTLFEFLGPLPGAFLGPYFGAVAVLFSKLINWAISGQGLDLITFVRFFPMVFAAIYFGTKRRFIVLVPVIAMLLFWAHPIGRQAWYYALLWLIPIAVFFGKSRLSFNALGSTFTAHAVGSVAFLYATNLPAIVWKGLIPVVLIERAVFAAGIWVSYIAISLVLEWVIKFYRSTILGRFIRQGIILNSNRYFRNNS